MAGKIVKPPNRIGAQNPYVLAHESALYEPLGSWQRRK
jgi:hypothetical protein